MKKAKQPVVSLLCAVLSLSGSATTIIAAVRREAVPASLTIRTAGAAASTIEGELVRSGTSLLNGGSRPADIFFARDPQNGLTFRRILAVSDRPFAEAQELSESFLARWRIVEHDHRIYRFTVSAGVVIEDFTSQPKQTLLRNVVREGDHWLVTIEGPAHRIAILVIDDRDRVIAIRPGEDR